MKATSPRHPVDGFWRRWGWTLLVLGIGSGVTTGIVIQVTRETLAQDADRFERLTRTAWERIETRIELQEQALGRLRDRFEIGSASDPGVWDHQLAVLDPGANFPELSEVGLVWLDGYIWVEVPSDESRLEFHRFSSWRRPDWPARPADEALVPIGWGGALPRSYHRAAPAITPPCPAWNDRTGAVIRGLTMIQTAYNRMPSVEADDPGANLVRDRMAAVRGFAFATFVADDLLKVVFGDGPREVALEIFDGTSPVLSNRWNTFPPEWIRSSPTGDAKSSWKPRFTNEMVRPSYGEKLLIRAYSTPWFEQQSKRDRPRLIAWTGGLLTAALGGLVFVQVRGRLRAEDLARDLSASRSLLRSASADRERMSRDLHDGTLQSLYAVGLGLGRTRRQVHDPAIAERLDHALQGLEGIVGELRGYLVEMDPGISPAQRAELAIAQVVARLRLLTASEIHFDAPEGDSFQLPTPLVLDLLFVVREGVGNALRHGRASRIGVRLGREGGRIRLEVRDDGHGFDPEMAPNGHRGLENLRHRAAAHSGRLEIVSKPGGPTRLSFVIPHA